MTQYACIRLGTDIVTIREFDEKPANIPHKALTWMPYVEETIDTSTTTDKITIVNQPVIEADRVYKLTTIRDMTTQELAARDAAAKTAAIDRLDVANDITKALGAVVFELVNKDRQRDGLQPLTANQFRTYVRSKL